MYHVIEPAKVRGLYTIDANRTSIYKYLEKEIVIYNTSLGKSDHAVLEFDYVINKDTTVKLEGKLTLKKKCRSDKYSKLNSFYRNTY